jgi:ATP-dependent RNA helicase DDX56/DBP9
MGACTFAGGDDDPETIGKKGPMSADAPPPSFEGLGIDAKILQALHKRKLERPTAVQAACIPEALLGRDLVATARTGAGKTVAYLVPVLQRLLETAERSEGGGEGKAGNGGNGGNGGKGKRQPFQTLILVPTRELCEQVLQEAKLLALACSGAIRVTSLNGEGRALQQSATTAGQIVVATPGRVAELIRSGMPVLGEHLSFMVLDEADLLLSYGYEEDMDVIAPCVPRSCQCMLVSATTSDDVLKLTKLVLTNPVSLDLTKVGVSRGEDGNGDSGGEGEDGGQVGGADVDHRELALPAACGKPGSLAEMTERLLLLLTLLKFGLVDKKVLIFVNSPDAGMRARLFLDAFGIQCSELHAEMPLNTRNHVLQQFNKGLFDYLIATDDVYVSRDAAKGKLAKGRGPGARAAAKSKNEEAGVTRGIDFRGVKTVINLEMPPSVPGYVHRVGRTGRGGEAGTAVSLFSAPYDDEMRDNIKENLQRTQKLDLKTFDKVTKVAVEGLRYRAEDVARSITKSVIREARTKDIKTELMNSKRLEEFFEERPADLRLIKHDRSVASSVASAAAPHLKHVPGYLRDPLLQGKSFVGRPGNGFLPARKRRKADAKIDPVKGFMKAPRKGEVEATAMELRAEESAKRERKRLKKKGVALPGEDTFVKKRNVRKKR